MPKLGDYIRKVALYHQAKTLTNKLAVKVSEEMIMTKADRLFDVYVKSCKRLERRQLKKGGK